VPNVVERLSLHTVPLTEVSGLAVEHVAGAPRMIVVADESPLIAMAPIGADGPGEWSTFDVSETYSLPESGSNFEAVAIDAAGVLIVLVESPPALLVLDLVRTGGARRVTLDVASAAVLSGHDLDPLRNEGVVLLRSGHVLVAREKDPIAVFEFGPAGDAPLHLGEAAWLPGGEPFAFPAGDDEYVALAWWPVDTWFDDVSDLALHGGQLYVLSDESDAIGRLALSGPGEPLKVDATWTIEPIHRKAKPEGLAFLPDGTFYIAHDRAESGRNLAHHPPLPT
jgi:hypothetical protein